MDGIKTCTPLCAYFSCDSDVLYEKNRCSCDKYDIWVNYQDRCKDSDEHFTPVHNDFNDVNDRINKLLGFSYYTSAVDHTAKHDEGKLQIHLVPPQIIRDIAEVRMYGNDKYGDPDNWKTVEKWRYVDALLRHLLLYLEDPDGVDEESGIKHYKHAACNMAFICAMEEGNEQ